MADKKTVVYEIRVEEGQAIQAFEALNLAQQDNRDRMREITAAIKENKAATAAIVGEIDAVSGATAEQNEALENLKTQRQELNRQQAEAVLVGKDLASQSNALVKEILSQSQAAQGLAGSQDQQAQASARQADAMLAATERAKLLSAEADRLFDNFNQGNLSDQAFLEINSALIDTRAELQRNKAALAENGKAEQQLAADIRQAGVATAEQAARMEQLSKQRADLKAVNTSLVTTEGSLAAIYRETKNDVTGLTEAELRFRDKMADATTEAIKKSGALAELQAITAKFTSEQDKAADKLARGEITQRQYNNAQTKAVENIQLITQRSQQYSARLDELNSKLKTGEITEQQFKQGVKELTTEVESFGREVVQVADTSMAALRTQLREARADAQRAFEEFGRGSAEFQAAAARVDDLDDSIKEVNISVQAIDLEGKIEVAGRVAQGIAGGFQVATGTLALFGAESDDVQEALLRVQSAIAIGQGVSQLVEGTKAMRGFAIAIGLTTASQEAQAVATGVATTATGAQTAATGAATVATRVLGAAMNALPILAIAGALAGLVAIVSNYTSETTQARRSYQEFLDTINQRAQKSALTSELEKAQLLSEFEKERQQRILDFEQGKRASVEQTAEEQQRDAERLAEIERGAIQVEKQAIDERKKAFDELRALKQAAVGDRDLREAERIDVQNSQALADLRVALELDESATKEEIVKAYYDKKNEFSQSNLTSQAQIAGRETELLKGENDKREQSNEEFSDRQDQRQREAEQRAQERAQRLAQVEEGIAQQLAAIRERAAARTTTTTDDDALELDRIRDKYARQIQLAEGFTDQIKQLEGLRDQELLDAQQQQQERRIAALEDFKAKEAEAIFSAQDAAVRAEEAKWEAVIIATRQQAEAAGEARSEIDAQVAAQEAQRDQALLQARLARIDAETEAERQAIIQKYEALFAEADRNEQDTAALQAAAGAELFAAEQENAAAKVQLNAETNATIAASNEAARQAELEQVNAMAGSIAALADQFQAFSDAQFDSKIRDVTDETAALQEQMNATDNEQEKARIKERIDGLNKEKAALEQRKKDEKGFAVFSALINTYLAAQQVLANPAFPDPISKGIAMAATIAAGLLNVAKLQGFDRSGKVRGESGVLTEADGRPIRRDNGDNLLVTAQVGEMYVNEYHQRRAQMLFGDDVWKRIGIPGFAGSGVVARDYTADEIRGLSGYAGSGVVNDLFVPQLQPQVITQIIQTQGVQQLAERPVIVDIREVTSAQDRVARINEMTTA